MKEIFGWRSGQTGPGSSAVADVTLGPVALNASTTYGLDTSAANNYGLGPSFLSTQGAAVAQAQKAAAPSYLWLIALLIIAWKVL